MIGCLIELLKKLGDKIIFIEIYIVVFWNIEMQ